MVNYNCKLLLLSLLKKWYIVLATMLIFGGISVPLANLSLKNVEKNYEQLQVEEGNRQFNAKVIYAVEAESTGNIDIYIACLKDGALMHDICKEHNKYLKWKEVENLVEYSYDLEEAQFVININEATEEEIKFLLDASTIWLSEYFGENNAGKILLKREEILQAPHITEEMIVSELVAEPIGTDSYRRVIVTAMIMGAVLGCFIALMMDYVAKDRKLRE